MATIKYLLLKAKLNKEGKAPLQIAVYDESSTELISTGETIKPLFWDKENQRVRQRKDTPDDAAHIDEILLKLKKEVVKVKSDLKTESEVEPSAYEIKKAWQERLNNKKNLQKEKNSKQKEDEKLLTVRIDKWIAGLTHKPLTVKAITNSLKKFKAFVGPGAEMKDLTKEKCDEYGKWLFEKKKKMEPLSKSSHGRHIKHLRWFIKSLTPRPFDFRDLKIHNSRKKIISLSLEELKKLEAVDVSKSVEKQKSKDLFLLGCYTSLRISDLRRISKSCIHTDIYGNREIHLTTLKNKKDVEIPILPEAWEILSRYEMKAPKISEQTVNSQIKEICKDAKIDTMIKITSTKGNKHKEQDIPKHDLITLHISGKTFISLAEERWGLTVSQVASICGKDIKTIAAHYKSLDNKTAKEKMREFTRPIAVNQ